MKRRLTTAPAIIKYSGTTTNATPTTTKTTIFELNRTTYQREMEKNPTLETPVNIKSNLKRSMSRQQLRTQQTLHFTKTGTTTTTRPKKCIILTTNVRNYLSKFNSFVKIIETLIYTVLSTVLQQPSAYCDSQTSRNLKQIIKETKARPNEIENTTAANDFLYKTTATDLSITLNGKKAAEDACDLIQRARLKSKLCLQWKRRWIGGGWLTAYSILLLFTVYSALIVCDAFSIREVIRASSGKRTAGADVVICPTWHPFQCPNGDCIPIKYLCDGSPDCSDEYDENKSMCTAAVRPPVEETASFLKALLSAHGADFLVKLFGVKAKDALRGMGGVDQVAVAISQSPTLDVFASEMNLKPEEMERLASILEAISSGATSDLTSDEAGDFRFFVQKLQETGFF